MWHEARKQERLIRGMIVDYRRRAERRKDFYEKIKAEPTQFLQLHGRQCKIHLDPAVAAAGEGPAIMMPWQGDQNNMIDRFDVRAHLDYIPDIKFPDIPPEELSTEERQCNYERYRILAQNVFLGISEDKFLQQLAIEEQFGVTIEEKESQKEKLSEKKGTGVAIGYNYNDPGTQPSSYTGTETKKVEQKDSDDDSDLEIIDVDLSIDVNKMEASQAHELNAVGPQFGMAGCDLFSFLTGDADDAEHQKQLMREEKEKAMFSGRKSRRERRAHRDKKLATRAVSPPSYAAPSARTRAAPPSRSVSRSPTPDAAPTFITSFGPDDDDKPSHPPKPLYADKLKLNLKKNLLYSEVAKTPKRSDSERRPQYGPRMQGSRSRSRSSSRSRSRSPAQSWRKSRSRSKSRSPSSRSRSRSPYRRTRSRSRSRSRSASRSRNYGSRRSRSPSNHASGYLNRNRSSSKSYDSGECSSQNKPALPRYYGRRKEDKSSSELSLDSDSSDSGDNEKNKSSVGNKSHSNQNQLRLSGASSKGPSKETLTMKERLKRKMQAQLAKQLRLDKRAEAQRLERERGRQARRDEEMRELAIKLRRRQREMRHQQYRRSSDDDSDRSRSGSSSRHSPVSEKKRIERSRSKSKSPVERPLPVKEPSPYKSRYSDTGEHAQYTRRRVNDPSEPFREGDKGRRYEDDRGLPHPNKHERYSRDHRNFDTRHEQYERFEDKGPGPSWRRPHEQRPHDQRPHDQRPYEQKPPELKAYKPQGSRYEQSHGDGSSWRSRDTQERDSGGSYKKVKLVDY